MSMNVGSSSGDEHGEVMVDINTTPLIDVMLVLLIMFIITIPIQTHAVKIDLPQNTPNQTPPPIKPDINKLTIDDARVIYWNGAPIDIATLQIYLAQTKDLNPEPELHVEPSPGAPYAIINDVMSKVKRSGVGKMGFVGNDRYQSFGK